MGRPSVRHLVVAAAVDRFHDQGFDACSVQDITDAAGVPKGSFSNHFKTKLALAIEALGTYQQDAGFDLLFEGKRTPIERIRDHLEYMASLQRRSKFSRGCIIGNFAAEMANDRPEMRKAVATALEDWSQAIATVLRQAQQIGEIDLHSDSTRLARYTINGWQGSVLRMKVVRSRAPLDDFFDVTFGLILKSPNRTSR